MSICLVCQLSVCVFPFFFFFFLVGVLKHFVPVDFIYQFIFLFIVLNVT